MVTANRNSVGYNYKEISKLFNPFIECGDYLIVHREKQGIRVFFAFLFGILLILSASFFTHGKSNVGFILLGTILVLGVVCYSYSRQPDIVLVVDKDGITLFGEFYPWEIIQSVKYGTDTGINRSHLLFYLKSMTQTGIVRTEGLIINDLIDQPLKVIAAYIIKFHKQDQSQNAIRP